MPSVLDPASFQLAEILTAAGATVAAGIVASLILLLERVPTLGPWIESNTAFVSELLSFVLVAYAFFATTVHPDAVNAFAAILAWIGIATLTTGAGNYMAKTQYGVTLSGKKPQ